MTHEELRELTGAYSLGVLGEPERRELEAHLATCTTCAEELRGFRAVAQGLALAVEQHDPPAGLRERVLAVAGAQQGRVMPPAPQASSSPGVLWLAVAASIAAIALGLYAMALRSRVSALDEQLRAVSARTADTEQQLAALRTESARTRLTTAILASSDARPIQLASPTGTAASGRAFWSPSRGLVFTAAGLPALPAGRAYQLWIIPPGGAPVGMGLLPAETTPAIAVASPPGVTRVATVAVSVEPAGGVPAPTGPIVLAGSVSN
jgi:anti-sigma-K factor RskA